MCKYVNSSDTAWALFLEPLRSARCVCHTSGLTRNQILLTTNWRNNRRKTALHERTLRQLRNNAKDCARSALVSRHQQTLYSAWFTKHTTRLRIHPCACLKHSNFLNTDRMRKSGLSNGCSRETLLLFSLQQLSPGTCPAASEQLKS